MESVVVLFYDPDSGFISKLKKIKADKIYRHYWSDGLGGIEEEYTEKEIPQEYYPKDAKCEVVENAVLYTYEDFTE